MFSSPRQPVFFELVVALVGGFIKRILGASVVPLTFGNAVGCCLLSLLVPTAALSQTSGVLERSRFRTGDQTLKAFSFIAQAGRHSIVKVNIDGGTVALGTVVGPDGLAITKASELKPGKLTCWLAGGKEVDCELIVSDEEHDLALLRVHSSELKPIVWAEGDATVGQWAVTPGIEEAPHAVGIVSTRPRRIRFPRAYLGIQFDMESSLPKVRQLLPGLGAEKAGLAVGDVIVALDGTSVSNREQVVNALLEYHEGQSVKLTLERDERRIEKEIVLKVPTPAQLGADTPGRSLRIEGEVSSRASGYESVIQHDTVLQPWLCGGPLMNLQGKAVGVNIARAGRVATYTLPAAVVQRVVAVLTSRIPTASTPEASN